MAVLTITNLTNEALLLQELYTTVEPGGTVTTTRYHDALHSVPRIQALWEAGKIAVSVTSDASEADFIFQKVRHDGYGGGPNGPVDLLASSVKHVDIATAGSLKQGQGATTPDVVYKGNLVYMEFNQTTDVAFYLWKVGRDFKDSPAFHVHWTKSQDINESSNRARWRIDYTVYTSTAGTAGNAAVTGTFVDTGDLIYVGGDANTDRLVYRSPDMPIVATAGQYVAAKISSPLPGAGTPVTNPGLVSVDFTYNAYINKPT
jgi:hypothetical protein